MKRLGARGVYFEREQAPVIDGPQPTVVRIHHHVSMLPDVSISECQAFRTIEDLSYIAYPPRAPFVPHR